MFFRVQILAVFLVLPLLTQCGTKTAPEAAAVTGPFDSSGNYREDWVNSPEKWYRPDKPSTTKKKKTQTRVVKRTPAPAPTTAPAPLVQPTPISPLVSQPAPVVVSRPTPVVRKPAPTVVKPKPKPKPKVVARYKLHTVRRGDNLTKLASRNGTSVSAIKKANNLRSDLIMLGQKLKIPR